MGALFHRERTGEAVTVDVSLLGTGIWAMGAALALSLQLGMPWAPPPRGMNMGNPLVGAFKASDGKYVSLSCLQAGRYWAELVTLVGLPELATDERFADAAAIRENAQAGVELLREHFATKTAAEWRDVLQPFSGQWAMVQDTIEASEDPQTIANGYVVSCETSAGTPFQLAAAPVQFGSDLPVTHRAPEFNEHGDEILESIGLDMEQIIDLKVRGVVA
jgi:crotonobetainyl-CoA:carnitine CoA-transferase CaiB-like acyl-CoA transferase